MTENLSVFEKITGGFEGGPLFHYTSLEASQNILTSQTLRMYHILNMPDRDEYVRGIGVIEGYFYSKIRATTSSLTKALEEVIKQLHEAGQAAVFVCSLTRNPSCDKLWEEYGAKKTGSCITVEAQRNVGEFIAWPRTPRPLPIVICADMIYSREKFLGRLDSLVVHYANKLEGETDAVRRTAVSKDFAEKLHLLAALLKDEYFRDEEEVRFAAVSLTERRNNDILRYIEGVDEKEARFSGHVAFMEHASGRNKCFVELARYTSISPVMINLSGGVDRPDNGMLNIREVM